MDSVITLGKCSDFFLTMLGDFCSKNGMDAKIQKDYKEEKTKSRFGKYNFNDRESDLSKIKIKFERKIIELNAYSKLSIMMLDFPEFIQESIKHYDPRLSYYFSETQIVTFLLVHYIAYFYKYSKEKSFFKKFLYENMGNTYDEILKNSKVNFNTLEENCNWSTLEEILECANTQNLYDDKKELNFDCFCLVQHYLFLGFIKALKNVFHFSEQEIDYLKKLLFNLDFIIERQDYFIKNYTSPVYKELDLPFDNSKKMIFSFLNIDCDAIIEMFYSKAQWVKKILECEKYIKEMLNPQLKNKAIQYFINSYTKITKKEGDKWIMELEKLDDEYYNKVIIPWYKARIKIFSLTFTNEEKDKKLKEEACKLFRDTFNNYKYLIGNNLEEFLSDAIICDVYCNPKKDIFNNSQDNTDESSILIPGKTYWEFGYALNIFDEDSKKTYLLTYNAEDNFWVNFPPQKFENQKKALKKCHKETENSEFMLPILLNKFNDSNKIDNLLYIPKGKNGEDKKPKIFRLLIGTRYYSYLSIRCLKENTLSNFDIIKKFIERMNKIFTNDENTDILFTNDENGANALLRSLWRYKMLSYGYTDENIVERARIFNEFYTNININNHNNIVEHGLDSYSFEQLYNNIDLRIYEDEKGSDFYTKISDLYKRVSSNLKSTEREREALKSEIKKKIILPLIRNAGKHITDEAIVLDGKKCVSALQIAIDCFDFEIVKEIVDNLPEKINLSKHFISSEYVTALSYAIRKYDYLMQFCDMLFSKSGEIPLEKREIQSRKKTEKGILSYDKDFYIDEVANFIESCPREECGLFVTPLTAPNKNICCEQQKNLIEIIKLLAQKTNPISVDTFYYLADQIDPTTNQVFSDILDITKILIETDNADLCGTDFVYSNNPFMPSQTLLAYCINHGKKDGSGSQKNYGMLNFLLSNYPKKFEPIINRKIYGFDNEGNARFDTDLHFFITNQIESIILWNKMGKEEYYGKEIAVRMSNFLLLFINAGARIDIPDQDGKTVKDLLIEWKDRMPEGCIPEEISL